jgi:hypothetical protein
MKKKWFINQGIPIIFAITVIIVFIIDRYYYDLSFKWYAGLALSLLLLSLYLNRDKK